MMKKTSPKFICIIMCVIGISSCHQATDNSTAESFATVLPAIDAPWNSQNSIVCFGTSLTYGYGAGGKKTFWEPSIYVGGGVSTATTGDSSYPRFLNEALRINVINRGYVGARTAYGLSIVKDSVLSCKPAIVLLEFGANEFLQNVDSHETDSVLSMLIQNIQQGGAKVVLLSFIHPDMTKYMGNGSWTSADSTRAIAYAAMLSDVSKRFSVPMIAYPLEGVFGHPSLLSDSFHPNGAGYMRMEHNIFNALRNTFEQNGMMR